MIEYAEGELFQILEDDGHLSLGQVIAFSTQYALIFLKYK